MMKSLKNILLAFSSILILLSGCGSDKRVVVAKQNEVPSWYQMPSQSNANELYALGEGKDKQEAISNALSFMVSTLSVSISSSYNAKTVVKEGSINSSSGTYSNEVQSDVKQIRISNYEVMHAQSLGFKRYAVLIKSNKKKLFESMKQEIEQEFSIIEQEKKDIKKSNAIKRLAFYKSKNESLKNLPNTLIVMSTLKNSFDGARYIIKAQALKSAYHDLIQNISFSIDSNDDASNLKAEIAKGLSHKRLKIKKEKAKTHFNIYINAKIQKAFSYGFTLARTEISLITKDYTGAIVGSSTLHIVGQSSQGYEVARQSISYKLNALIKKDGIASVLGLDI